RRLLSLPVEVVSSRALWSCDLPEKQIYDCIMLRLRELCSYYQAAVDIRPLATLGLEHYASFETYSSHRTWICQASDAFEVLVVLELKWAVLKTGSCVWNCGGISSQLSRTPLLPPS